MTDYYRKVYGINPQYVGLNYLNHYEANGELIVRTRDGRTGRVDWNAIAKPNYNGHWRDGDIVYYRFTKLDK